MIKLNDKIGKYRLTKLLAEGGMAKVFEGTHEHLGTKVAIKILNPILSASEDIRTRFRNEAKVMASLKHPNIVQVIDYEEQAGCLAILMELLEGQDLNDYVKKNGAMPVTQAVQVFSQILDALAYAHAQNQGIVHRDIKPSNIFVAPNLTIKILDFGIAKIFGDSADKTQTGLQLGTPVYMSPEQVLAKKDIDKRSDIYSLGVTLFFALKGHSPYKDNTSSNFEIYKKIVEEPLPEIEGLGELNGVIQKAVEKDREKRFGSAGAFKKELEVVVKNEVGGVTVVVKNSVQKVGGVEVTMAQQPNKKVEKIPQKSIGEEMMGNTIFVILVVIAALSGFYCAYLHKTYFY